MNEERPILYLTEFRCSNFPSMRSETLKPVWGTGTRPYFETSSYWFIFISFQNEKEKKNLRELPSRVVQSCFRHSIENWATLTELFSIFIDLSIWLRHRIFASYVRTAHSGLKRGTHKKKHFDPEQNRCSFCFLKKKDHPNRSKRNPMRIYSRCNSFINRFLFEMEAKKRMRDENRLRFSVSITIYWYEKSVFFCSWIISFTLKVWFETWCRRFLFGFF